MRIISGKFKGISLYLPKNKNTRPLKDMVRESIFNILEHSNKILFKLNKSTILDLYAGTGSFGLECISRGSQNVYFVEKDKDAAEVLKKNLEKLKLKNKSKIVFNDVFELAKKNNAFVSKFDLIFFDPPFKNDDVNKLINLIHVNDLLSKNGLLILHRKKNTNENFPDYLKIIEERIYGVSKIFFAKFLS